MPGIIKPINCTRVIRGTTLRKCVSYKSIAAGACQCMLVNILEVETVDPSRFRNAATPAQAIPLQDRLSAAPFMFPAVQ